MLRRLLSGRAIQIGLLVLLPVLILSFFALGRLRHPTDQPESKPVPQVTHPVARPQAEPETTAPAQQPETPSADAPAGGFPPADKAEAGASPAQPPDRPVATPQPVAQPQARPQALAPIQPAAPVWQTLGENWDKARPSNPPQLNAPSSQKIPWRQLDLGQTEEVEVGKGQKPLEIASMRKSPEERKKEQELEKKQELEKAKAIAKEKEKIKPPAPPKPSSPSVKPEAASPSAQPDTSSRLAIVDQSGRPELGKAYRDVLGVMGFPKAQIIRKTPSTGATQVYYKPDAEPLARRIFDRLPGRKTIEPLSWESTFDVVVIVQRGAPRLDASAGQ
jgi:hypothetical protein